MLPMGYNGETTDMKKLMIFAMLLLILGSVAFSQTNENWLQKLFPIYGVTLLETTIQDAENMGYKCKKTENGNTICYIYNKHGKEISVWDFDKDGIFDDISIYYYNFLPELWKQNFEFDLSKSYEEWLSIFQKFGFTVTIDQAPTIKRYNRRKTLSAKISAVSPDELIRVRLNFNYGNDNKKDGYTTISKNTLYSRSL